MIPFGKDVQVTHLYEKTALLLSENSPFSRLAGSMLQPPSHGKRLDRSEQLYGIKNNTLRKWFREKGRKKVKTDAWESLASHFNAVLESYHRKSREAYSSTTQTVSFERSSLSPVSAKQLIQSDKYDFGRLLGLEWKDTRTILEREIYLAFPEGSLLTFQCPPVDGATVDRMNRWLSGFFVAWHTVPVIQNGKASLKWVRSWIEVSKTIRLKDTDRCVVRCRWNMPRATACDSEKGYQYYGSVTEANNEKAHILYWLLEAKKPEDLDHMADMLQLVTAPQDFHNRNHDVHVGRYQSKNYDNLPYGSTVLLYRTDICFLNSEEGRNRYIEFRRKAGSSDYVFDTKAEALSCLEKERSGQELGEYRKSSACVDTEIRLLSDMQSMVTFIDLGGSNQSMEAK